MPPLDVDWAFLEDRMAHIMKGGPLSHQEYLALYTAIYNNCFYGKDGFVLYSNLIDFFAAHLKPLKDASESLQDEALLQYYAREWDQYTAGAGCINRLFAYLNRDWINRKRMKGRKGVYPVYTLSLVQWKSDFFIHVQSKNSKLAGAILRLIERQRNGQEIDQGLVKKVVDSFVSLGLDEANIDKTHLGVYKEHLEVPLLEATEKYYKLESEAFLAENSISDYLQRAEEWLREEEDRAERYLNANTRKPLISKCEHVLIREHLMLIQERFQSLLDYDKDEDLQRVHALLARIPDGLEWLRTEFEEHMKKAGLAAVARLVREGSAVGEVDPKAYVEALFEVHRKSSETVKRNFKGEAGFVASLNKACRDFVNKNAVTGTLSAKSPELLAEHADALLRKNNKMSEEEDLERALNRTVLLFKYLEDKDIFQAFYTAKFSKRLVHGVSASSEAEASMISRLKEACGFQYTNKLQHMFTDTRLSKDLTDQFKKRMAQNYDDMDINFSILVLGTNFWPLSAPNTEFNIPADILPVYNRFSQYYRMKHSGRKLIWLWNYSKNELRTNYLNQKYILMTSSYQTAVLLQYNDNDTLSLDELATATAISKDILTQVLAILVKAKILVNEEKDQYYLNPNFKSKTIRINLNSPIEAEVKAESANVLKTVDDDRKCAIQATIVRIMKARKTMETNGLIQEVTSQVSQRFAPKIPDLRKAIDTLLEKEYIARVEGAPDTFSYVA